MVSGSEFGLDRFLEFSNFLLRSWLCHAESTQRIFEENYSHITDAAVRLTVTVEENVLVQLEHLRTHPTVAAALSRKALSLHGWVYKFETGQVFAYHPQDGRSSSLKEQASQRHRARASCHRSREHSQAVCP